MRACGISMLVLLVIAAGAASGVSAQRPTAQTPTPPAISGRPVVELTIKRWAAGERVWFLVGVEVDPGGQPIPAGLIKSLKVIIVRPDGTQRIDQNIGPECGFCAGVNTPGDQGWMINRNLGSGEQQLGKWQVFAEFGGRRSPPATFTIEEIPFLKDIQAEFVIPGPILAGAMAKLIVRNQSREVVRFPLPGQNGTSVSLQLERVGSGVSSFVVRPTWLPPQAEQPRVISLGRMTWDFAESHFSMVTVQPNSTYELSIPIAQAILDANLAIPPPSGYIIRLTTQLDIMPGEPNGAWKDFAPLRISVTSATKAQWQ